MKKVGIITMHRVINAGSVLQAYALYAIVKRLGYGCEIIDYQYPNEYHASKDGFKCSFFVLLWKRLKYWMLYRSRIQKRRFSAFMRQYLELSDYYPNQETILQHPPCYDIYMTGSDQVWNPKGMKGDSAFFCSFAKNGTKISYASSFSSPDIPIEYRKKYTELLSGFQSLSVREASGVELIRFLTGRTAIEVCDPTLLLEKEDYSCLAEDSEVMVQQPYVLAYILTYAYDPYPAIQRLIDKISALKGLRVYYLYANSVDNYHWGKSITSAGPKEFLRLFRDASFVITSSFHGTVFALNFEKNFYSIVPSGKQEDERISSLLQRVGASDRAIKVDEDISKLVIQDVDYSLVSPKVKEYRAFSLEYLQNALTNNGKEDE